MTERIDNTTWRPTGPHVPPEDAREQRATFIEWALQCAESGGTTIDQFLIRNELISAEDLYRTLANILSVPFTAKILPIAHNLDGDLLIKAETCPLLNNGDRLSFAIAPTGQKFVALLFAACHGSIHLNEGNVVITTPQNFIESVRMTYGRVIAQNAVEKMQIRAPYLSAYQNGMMKSATILLSLSSLFIFSFLVPTFWHSLIFLFTLFPGIPSILLKAEALKHSSPIPPSHLTLIDQDLPSYTILVPLYRERKIISKLISRLKRIDYPKAKLEIKILVELDDVETRLALLIEELPAIFEIVVCPMMNPRTKPRALNIGLAYARGDYIVVYDAEDEPDPDQLRKAVHCFHQGGKRIGCVQGRLAIDNSADSWISRMFALEYAGLFDALLPGMAYAKQPIPLGGTSNHFRRTTLEACFAWDPWNVTEDADLGLRLARLGYETAIIDSTTWEEAPNTLPAWINQRTRWLKGWIQTAIVVARPLDKNWTSISRVRQFQITVISLASITSALFNPLIVLFLGWIIALPCISEPISRYELAQWCLIALVFIGHLNVSYRTLKIGMRHRGFKFYWLDVLSISIYSLLKCFAAWRALWEFVVAPSLWRKTEHGHSRTSRRLATKAY